MSSNSSKKCSYVFLGAFFRLIRSVDVWGKNCVVSLALIVTIFWTKLCCVFTPNTNFGDDDETMKVLVMCKCTVR